MCRGNAPRHRVVVGIERGGLDATSEGLCGPVCLYHGRGTRSLPDLSHLLHARIARTDAAHNSWKNTEVAERLPT